MQRPVASATQHSANAVSSGLVVAPRPCASVVPRTQMPGTALHAVAARINKRKRDPRFPGVYHLQPVVVPREPEGPTELQQQQAGEEIVDARPSASPSAQHVGPITWPNPSPLFLADFSTRVALERLFAAGNDSGEHDAHQAFPSIPGPVPQETGRSTAQVPEALHAEFATDRFAVTVDDKPQKTRNEERTPDYFANCGDAIRTLRDDIPALFQRELNYSIYREDVVFKDPRNTFEGIKNYKLIFWSLRFHGKIFFSKLYVEVKRIWQPSDNVIKMRWTVHGIPRVPWEAEGLFDGISTYKLDNTGRVYEHCVDNVLLRDPPMLTNPPLLAGLNLVPNGPAQQPYPGAWGSAMTGNSPTVDSAQPAAAAATASSWQSGLSAWLQPHHRGSMQAQSGMAAEETTGMGVHWPGPNDLTASDAGVDGLQGPPTAPAQVAAVDHADLGKQKVGRGKTKSPTSQVLTRFSWVRLYLALWASVLLLGSLSQDDSPPLPSPSH